MGVRLLKIIKNILLSCICLFIILAFTADFYDNSNFLEIIVSFQPYNFALSIGFIFVAGVIFVRRVFVLKNREVNLKKIMKNTSHLALLLLFLFCFAVTSFVQIYKFSYKSIESFRQTESSVKLKVGFYNKYFFNENFDEISNKIKEMNFDILGLGELKSDQRERIEAFKDFKYTVSKNCDSCEYKEDVALYSKYPIINPKIYTFEKARVIEADVVVSTTKTIRVFVIHTTAPSLFHSERLVMRNKELESLPDVINSAESYHKIVLGDFNVSPWSSSMEKFEKKLVDMTNAARGRGLKFTWNAGPLATQLDHIFVSKNIFAEDFIVEGDYGSDHRMVWSLITI